MKAGRARSVSSNACGKPCMTTLAGAGARSTGGLDGTHRSIPGILIRHWRKVTDDLGRRRTFIRHLSAVMELLNALANFPQLEPAGSKASSRRLELPCCAVRPFIPHVTPCAVRDLVTCTALIESPWRKSKPKHCNHPRCNGLQLNCNCRHIPSPWTPRPRCGRRRSPDRNVRNSRRLGAAQGDFVARQSRVSPPHRGVCPWPAANM